MSFNATVNDRYTGIFCHRIFRSEETGYCVCLYSFKGDTTTVVGEDLPEVNYPVTFAGRWVNHKDHGLQFEADIVVEQIPSQPEDIITFIATAHVGIGKRKAREMLRLVDATEFWDVLLSDPNRFSKAITASRITKLQNKVKELTFMQNIAKICGNELKFDTTRYKRICSEFKDDLAAVPEMIQANPFILIRAGFEFKELDAYACKHCSLQVNSHERLLGACLQVLLSGQSRCHSALPQTVVLEEMDGLLRPLGRVSSEELVRFLRTANGNEEIALANDYCYLNRAFKEETALVNVLTELNTIPPDNLDSVLFADFLNKYEEEKGFRLSDDQKRAVWMAMTHSVSVITGGPGTGKSTILDAIRACWKSFRPAERCMLLAPTGRAAVRMSEVTGEPAGTIHSTLQVIVGNTSIEEMDEVVCHVEDELVIVDESSMVDQSTAATMMLSLHGRYAKKRQHLVIVGDPDQLPSVSYGNVLADIIASGVIPVCSLGTVYRQAADNPIVTNAGRIKQGITNLMWTPSFKGYHNGSESANKDAACRFYRKCVDAYGIENVVLLSPYHSKTKVSTDALNQELQEALNPDVGQPFLSHGKKKFRLRDRVMMLKNTEELNNGDIGTIIAVQDVSTEAADAHLTVEFENGVKCDFPKENLFYLDLAYALTVHKSQGGQYRVVLMIMPDNTSPFLQRNVVYTGITRSKEYFAVFGPPEVFAYAIRNDKYGLRHTRLAYRLQKSHEKRMTQAA